MNATQLENICRKTQEKLKEYVAKKLKKRYEKVFVYKDFVFAQGDIPICLVAHMDTVHKEPPKKFVYGKTESGKQAMSSPQGVGGDDRCGVYAILQIIQRHKCSVLFCCDEEVGGYGAMACNSSPLADRVNFNYMIELDRRGSNDAVFYDCDNEEFTDFVTKEFWKESYGSFSDISHLAPKLGCAAVNLSIGYYNQHTISEYIVLSELEECIEQVCKLIERTKTEDKFEYIEAYYDCRGYYGSRYSKHDKYSYYGGINDQMYLIQYQNDGGNWGYEEIEAQSEYEAIGKFLFTHETMCMNDIYDVINEGYVYT